MFATSDTSAGSASLSASAAAVYSVSLAYDDAQGRLYAYNAGGVRCESFAAGEQITLYAIPLNGYEVDHVYCTRPNGEQTAVYGSLMYGETQQRLYYSKGLKGTYQCVMTTKDGKTIYTCPQDFEDVQPSRSAGPEPNKVQTEMYDAMGRAIKGQPSKGIYVVIEEIDGERTAKKIIVNE